MIWNSVVGKARRIAREAARWHAEMEEPSSQAQVTAFETWLKADPAHVRAYHELEGVAAVGARLSFPVPNIERSAVASSAFRPAFAVAASLVLALGTWWLVREPSAAYAAIYNRGHATRMVALRDGSIVTLDTATTLAVEVAPTAHHVRMSSGRARFAIRLSPDVAFKVTTSAGEVTSANGVFDVAVARDDVRVWVVRGEARVAVPRTNRVPEPLTLRSGQSLRVRGGVATTTPSDRSDTTWPQAHLSFDDTPLATILEAANRTGRPKISVADDAVGHLRVTGVLDLRDTRKLARKLAAALDLRVVENDDTVLLTP